MRHFIQKVRTVVATAAATAMCFGTASALAAQQGPTTRFRVAFPTSAHAQPITGRIFVMVSDQTEREPRLQIGRTGAPFFGHDVEGLRPGQFGTIDATDDGSPVYSLKDLPAGDYYVQAMVNVYSEFRRSDGHVLWMHDDQWEGQRFNVSPGNLYSDVQRIHLDPAKGFDVELTAAHVIPSVEVPPDDQWVKRFKIQSKMLTEFWGRPVYIGATVLLPRDYDRETMEYPVLYNQGHFSLRNPLGFQVGNELYQNWVKDDFPRMIVVTFQHPTPYFDDSYAVNSANVGPYGDAMLQELIPEVERRFRIIKEPWARLLDGGSTGGWESLALQLFHPDFFGGVWSYCPDPVTFTNVEGVDVYEDQNFFYKQNTWFRTPIVNTRETDGTMRMTSQQRQYYELAMGTKGRSGEQFDIWSAVHGPVGDDGYFKPLFDKRTGVVDPSVAQYWREHYDLLEYMKRNWSTLAPKIYNKIHIYSGDMDNVRLDQPVRELQAWMKTTSNPHYEAFFVYGDRKGHCFQGPVDVSVRLQEMSQHILRFKPDWATTPWWAY
ncbi:MAG TPA: alpha/beta hydrolase-fold protein [Longimicrobiales bacterium]|nr:alpha/beta hydrolase-fold protein [Longimicrobiales bacterium]